MKNMIKMPYLTEIKRKNIQTEAGIVTLKYINPPNQTKEELSERLNNAPHLQELLNLCDFNLHKKIIIQCDDLNNGISAVGHIKGIMNGFVNKNVAIETNIFFDEDDIFFDDEDTPSGEFNESTITNADEDNFAILYESEFDSDCNNVGETTTPEQMLGKPKLNYFDFKNLIFAADGLFTLTEKSINFLQGFSGSIAVVIPERNKNTSAIKQLTFESDFETVKVKKPTIEYLARQFKCLAEEKGYRLNSKLNINDIIRQLINYRGNKFQEYDLSIYLEKNIKSLKGNIKEFKTVITLQNSTIIKNQIHIKDIIGLDEIKSTIYKELYRNIHVKNMEEKGHQTEISYKHIAFEGNPGTCKTTMARAVARLYQENNILSNGFYECGREDIVGRYLGETSQKVSKIFKMAKGGVIFIDEFGAIISDATGDAYGIESLNAIVRHMENNPDTMVIIATYPDELAKILSINPGLQSRFAKIIKFPDYSQKELLNILKFFTEKGGYTIEEGYEKIVLNYFETIKSNKNFGNGREVRKLFETTVAELSLELFKNKHKEINIITISAINNAVYSLTKNNKTESKLRIGFSV
jgi:hypothetical protein